MYGAPLSRVGHAERGTRWFTLFSALAITRQQMKRENSMLWQATG